MPRLVIENHHLIKKRRAQERGGDLVQLSLNEKLGWEQMNLTLHWKYEVEYGQEKVQLR